MRRALRWCGGILGHDIPSGQYRMSVFDANGRLMTQQEMNPLMLTDVHTAARMEWTGVSGDQGGKVLNWPSNKRRRGWAV